MQSFGEFSNQLDGNILSCCLLTETPIQLVRFDKFPLDEQRCKFQVRWKDNCSIISDLVPHSLGPVACDGKPSSPNIVKRNIEQ